MTGCATVRQAPGSATRTVVKLLTLAVAITASTYKQTFATVDLVLLDVMPRKISHVLEENASAICERAILHTHFAAQRT